jgi:quinol monooxygenase YgiN
MSIRLVVTLYAAPGKGSEFLQAFKQRCELVMREEAGCEQYEIFQSALEPDKLVLLEHWSDQETFDAHLAMNKVRPAFGEGLRGSFGGREDYVYNKL